MNSENLTDSYDDIIVGAGAAGAVIAARLSEDSNRRVLLIEAGVDYPCDSSLPAALLNYNEPVLQGHNWLMKARVRDESILTSLANAGNTLVNSFGSGQARMLNSALQRGIGGAANDLSTFDYGVGKVVGGSTAINGGLVLQGIAADYDEWSKFTNGTWNWLRVKRAFQQLESSSGNETGPIPVEQQSLEGLTKIQHAFYETCVAKGFSPVDSANNIYSRGISLVRKAIKNGQRMSTARTHLLHARQRSNLTILSNALVDKLNWSSDTRCEGVEVIVKGQRKILRSGRVVLSAGSLNTPPILMRSGIGDAAVLKAANVNSRLELKGVGKNLIDHAVVGLWAVPKLGSSGHGEATHQVYLRSEDEQRDDLHLYMLGGINTSSFPMLKSSLGSSLGIALAPCVMKPKSRGECRIVSDNPMTPPDVIVNCLKHSEDVRVIKQGVHLAWELLQSQGMAKHIERILTWNSALMAKETSLERAIATFVRPGWHVVGTARMGLADDPEAVVDGHGKVHGTENLWVADASIMPTIPNVPTSLTCMMLGEEIAAELRAH